MRAIAILVAALAVACGSVHDRSECSASADCPVGSYCARTPDGDICWPDAVPPRVEGVTVSCDGSPCLRSGTFHVEATVEDDAELAGVDVALLGTTVPLERTGGNVWQAVLPLARFPFPAFEADVVATVTARDGARNETSVAASPVSVTRHLFTTPLDTGVFSLTVPAIMKDGTVVAGATNGKVYFVTWDGSTITSVSVGTGQITAAPLIAGGSVWIGSEDNKVYELTKNGSTWDVIERADTGGAVRGSLAFTISGHVIATSESGVVYAITSSASKNSQIGSPFTIGPVIDEIGSIFAVAGGSVRRLALTAGIPGDIWTAPASIAGIVNDPLVCTAVLIAAANSGSAGLLDTVDTNGVVATVATPGLPSSGPAIHFDNTIMFPEMSKILSRWSSSGSAVAGWQTPDLLGAPRTPLILDDPITPFALSTSKGYVHALRSDGTIAWTKSFGTAALQPGNIYTPPGQAPGEVLSIAYFAGADGVLHAIIVDGELDANAPWPKAFHDPQNTNRAGPQP